MDSQPSFCAYWGKALPDRNASDPYHLLPFHSLDVAACGEALLDLPQFSLKSLAIELGWSEYALRKLSVFFLALHDLGKFSRAFQGLAPNMSPDLVPPISQKRYDKRHDTLGWMLWDTCTALSISSSSTVVGHRVQG